MEVCYATQQQGSRVLRRPELRRAKRRAALGRLRHRARGRLVGNDTISSIRVASGYQVTVYTDSGFAGQSKTFTADTADTAYVGDDFNDAISSFQVKEVGSTVELKNTTLTGFPPQGDVYQLQNPVDL
jgi:hypothetical protein